MLKQSTCRNESNKMWPSKLPCIEMKATCLVDYFLRDVGLIVQRENFLDYNSGFAGPVFLFSVFPFDFAKIISGG